MFARRPTLIFTLSLLVIVALIAAAPAQESRFRPWASNVLVPQAYSASASKARPIEITGVNVGVVILEQVATTTMDISLKNNSNQRQTSELLVPVPDGAVVRAFTFQGASSEPTAELLRKKDAREQFDSIVAKLKDPALLEFVGYNLVRSSVFPVEPNGEQKVRLTYEHLLTADGDRVDYELPRSESVAYRTAWHVSVKIKAKRPITVVYSPTHKVETARAGKNAVSVRICDESLREPGPFKVSYLLENGAVTASLYAFPNSKGNGGYFLLLAGLAHKAVEATEIKRELTLVIDRSGSMNGEKLEQAKQAALQVLGGLQDGESFNVIVYNDNVDSFASHPVEKNDETIEAARAYIDNVTARGGTNIHDAMLEAVRPKPKAGCLPIVMFLTDGLPTVGQTSEQAIRNVATQANTHKRRIFTFGVGVDVNTPLLDKVALETRGFATFVLPGEDVEVKVGRVFKGLDGPVLASPQLAAVDATGEPAMGRVLDLLPNELPDLFKGDQLVVLGRYVGDKPLHFSLKGNHFGKRRQFKFKFGLENAAVKNAFVARLWASRRIATLTDQIRDMGVAAGTQSQGDSRLKELTDEIVRLSTEFGILTEYTAFLAKEGTDLSERDEVLAEAVRNYSERAIQTRSGAASVNQELNNDYSRSQTRLNVTNGFWNGNLDRVSIARVQQLNDNAYYRRGSQWVDSRLVNEKEVKPSKVIKFGSPEFMEIAWSLAKRGTQNSLSLDGDILMQIDGEAVLIKAPKTAEN